MLTVDTNDFADLDEHRDLLAEDGRLDVRRADTPVEARGHQPGRQRLVGDGPAGPPPRRDGVRRRRDGPLGHLPRGVGPVDGRPGLPERAGQGQLDTADGPAVLLPNGHVLVTASPGVYKAPLHMFDFDGRALTEIAAPPDAPVRLVVQYDAAHPAERPDPLHRLHERRGDLHADRRARARVGSRRSTTAAGSSSSQAGTTYTSRARS